VHLAHNNRNQVCSVGRGALEPHKTRALVDCSVVVATLLNHRVFLGVPPPTVRGVFSTTLSSNKSSAFSDPTSPTKPLRTTASLVDNRPTAFSTAHNRANRHLNSLKDFTPPSWMAIPMGNRPSGPGFLKLLRRILDRLSHLSLPVSA